MAISLSTRSDSPSNKAATLIQGAPQLEQPAARGFQWFLEIVSTHGFSQLEETVRLLSTRAYPNHNKHQLAHKLREIIDRLELWCSNHEAVRAMSLEDRNVFIEQVEKYVLRPLYTRLFRMGNEEMDSKVDGKVLKHSDTIALAKDLCGPSYLSPTSSYLKLAQDELKSVEKFRAPRDKLLCVINCYEAVKCALTNALTCPDNSEQSLGRKSWCADDLLPVIIYTILKARVANVHSHIDYIRTFRSPRRLNDEEDFALTQFEIGIAFIAEDLGGNENSQASASNLLGNYNTSDELNAGLVSSLRSLQAEWAEYLELGGSADFSIPKHVLREFHSALAEARSKRGD